MANNNSEKVGSSGGEPVGGTGGGDLDQGKAPSTILGHVGSGIRSAVEHMSVEPVVFLGGASYWSMQVFMEVVEMKKICAVSQGYSPEVCSNLSAYPEENISVQKDYSIFVFYNSISLSVLPLIFLFFMGAWSDKYGRKIPLMVTACWNVVWSGGYLLNSWQLHWPMELIYLVTFLYSLGGGPQGIMSTAVAYISDVSSVKSRTGRVSTCLSLWYLGGPLGNLIGAVAIQNGGINLALSIIFAVQLTNFFYLLFYIKESHGPFAKLEKPLDSTTRHTGVLRREDVTAARMIKDFLDWKRVFESFQTTFRKREGKNRAILLTLMVSNMLRRAARGFYMYMFVGHALEWGPTIYTYWSSYRTLIAAAGSLVLVPVLTRTWPISDPLLIVLGALSMVGEYAMYGCVSGISTGFFMWTAPLAGLISNASIIAFKSMSTKLVLATEKGRVSAVMSATQSLMPMVGYAMYAPIYHRTVEQFPQAQFFFGALLNTLILITFLAIHLRSLRPKDDPELAETKEKDAKNKPVVGKTLSGDSVKASDASLPFQSKKDSWLDTDDTVKLSAISEKSYYENAGYLDNEDHTDVENVPPVTSEGMVAQEREEM